MASGGRRASLGITVLCLMGLVACARSDAAWNEAVRTDTPDGYTRYLQDHPKGEHAEQARTRRDALVDERDWGVARRSGSVAAYNKYLSAHPDGVWSELAQRRRDALAPAPPIAPAEPAVPAPSGDNNPDTASPPAGRVVQLGAFSTARSAREGWEKLRRAFVELQELSPVIDIEPAAGSSLYRLRVRFDDSDEAERICAALLRGGAECIPSQ
ncbi:MAG: SPOR domain-containing protein [Gammaproteobacteria bacterium]|nr:SPOR domain-containing protein [Gammaproteobacteria bacterium]